MQNATIKAYKKDPNTGDIILVANITDENGKPILVEDNQNDIEIRFPQSSLQKLIREELPTEEKDIQELIDKIREIRSTRILSVEKIDKEIQKVMDDSRTDFINCQNKLEIAKTMNIYKVKLSSLVQKRLLSKVALHEESELSLQLTKLKQTSSN